MCIILILNKQIFLPPNPTPRPAGAGHPPLKGGKGGFLISSMRLLYRIGIIQVFKDI